MSMTTKASARGIYVTHDDKVDQAVEKRFEGMKAEMVRAGVAIDRLIGYIGEDATRKYLDGFMGERRTWAQDDKESRNADE